MPTFLSFKSLEILAHLEQYVPNLPPGIGDFGRLLARKIDATTPITGAEFYEMCCDLALKLKAGKISHNLAERSESFYRYLLHYAPLIANVVFQKTAQVSEETQVIMAKRKASMWR